MSLCVAVLTAEQQSALALEAGKTNLLPALLAASGALAGAFRAGGRYAGCGRGCLGLLQHRQRCWGQYRRGW